MTGNKAVGIFCKGKDAESGNMAEEGLMGKINRNVKLNSAEIK